MKTKTFITLTIVALFPLAITGCTGDPATPSGGKHKTPQVTVPNGSSPASANAPHAPMNDTEEMRRGFNHGNGALWVLLPPDAVLKIEEPAQTTSQDDVKGFSRVKFGWWRGVRGTFTIEGRRLDAPAPPLRYLIHPDSYGDLGFIPSSLYFPTEGYWEITGHIDSQSLTFVVHVQKVD